MDFGLPEVLLADQWVLFSPPELFSAPRTAPVQVSR